MSAIFLVLAMAAAPARGEAFVRNVGPSIAGKPDCFVVAGRYTACVETDGVSGEVRRIAVRPRVWLTDDHADFDRENSLSHGEYLDVMARLEHGADPGEYRADDGPQICFVGNGLRTTVETWTNAAVSKSIVDGTSSVLEFDVIFYRRVAGRVRMKPCKPAIVGGKPNWLEIPCPELAIGPNYLTIDNIDYLVAPRDQRLFKPDEAVDVYVADLRN